MNICYLIWGVAFSEKNEPVVPQVVPAGIQELVLLKEVAEKKSPNKNVKPPKKSKTDKTQPVKCYSIGPFFEDEEIKILEEKLKKGGFYPVRKSITDKEPKSYWVYLPAAKTMEAAKQTASDLKAANVKDYFIIRTGKHAKAISLGLYNGYKRAKLRRENLNKLGFKVTVQTRYEDVTRHWLDFSETPSNKVKQKDWMQKDGGNLLQKIARPCIDPLPESS